MAPDPLTAPLAATVHATRLARGLSPAALAERSGVSRAMIGKIERAEAQPTAALLGRLSAALGLTLSELVARAEDGERRLVRFAEQSVWSDPASGYRRRSVSPRSGGPLELVEVELAPGAEISYPTSAEVFVHQQVWVMEGRLALREGEVTYELDAGDCVALDPPAARSFHNPTDRACRYLVAVTTRRA